MMKADSPKMVWPFWTQVARAFTWRKFAGIFGNTQEPSGVTGTLRLSTETVQFWFSWAKAVEHTANANNTPRATWLRTMPLFFRSYS